MPAAVRTYALTDGATELPSQAIEDVVHLVRSENRIRILAALADGAASRHDLEDTTGIARATIGRIVADFETRNCVERTPDRDYAATPAGERIVAELTPFLETMEAIERLAHQIEDTNLPLESTVARRDI